MNTGKLLIQTFNFLVDDFMHQELPPNHSINILYQYKECIVKTITQIRNQYYDNKLVLYNNEIYKVKPNDSFHYLTLIKKNQVFIGNLEQVHEWLITTMN